MARKLFEFVVLIKCAAVVAAETEEQARTAVETWERAWVETGDIIGVIDGPDLADIREPHSQDKEALRDEAHEVV